MTGVDDKPAQLIEGWLLAEDKQRDDFNYSTVYYNDFGAQLVMAVENLHERSEVVKAKNPGLADLLDRKYRIIKHGVMATRSTNGRGVDALTVNRIKYGLHQLDGQPKKGMMDMLKMGGGGGGGGQPPAAI